MDIDDMREAWREAKMTTFKEYHWAARQHPVKWNEVYMSKVSSWYREMEELYGVPWEERDD